MSLLSLGHGPNPAKALPFEPARGPSVSRSLALGPLFNIFYNQVRIESVTLDCAKVYFLDYGNHSWVPVQGLLTLPPHLLAPPFQALECSLENIEVG